MDRHGNYQHLFILESDYRRGDQIIRIVSQGALVEALQIASKTGANHAIMHSLATSTLILAREGQVIKAIELYALIKEDPLWKLSPWMERVVG